MDSLDLSLYPPRVEWLQNTIFSQLKKDFVHVFSVIAVRPLRSLPRTLDFKLGLFSISCTISGTILRPL